MSTVEKFILNQPDVEDTLDYDEYLTLIDTLLQDGMSTDGNADERYVRFSRLNRQRMKRIFEKIRLQDDLKSAAEAVQSKQYWFALTESWCGDAAQSLPIMQALCKSVDHIELRILLREKYKEVMDAYLTNGRSRSIPKLICVDAKTWQVLWTWGPRPESIQQLINIWRATPDMDKEEVMKRAQEWYIQDEGAEIQLELLQKIKNK